MRADQRPVNPDATHAEITSARSKADYASASGAGLVVSGGF